MSTAAHEYCKNLSALSELQNAKPPREHLTKQDREMIRHLKWLSTNLEIGAKACRACQGASVTCGMVEVITFMNENDQAFLEEKGFNIRTARADRSI